MLQCLPIRKACVVLAVIICSCFGGQNSCSAEEVVGVLPAKDSTENIGSNRRPVYDSNEDAIFGLQMRVETLESRLKYMERQLGQSVSVRNVVREAQALASDAWTLAVEARTIALRAEEKAGEAAKNKTK